MNVSALKAPLPGFLKIALTVLSVLFVTLQSCKKDEKEDTPTGIITGVVLSKDNLPLSGVKVSLNNKDQTSVYSDEEGKYMFSSIIVGEYSVLAAKDKDAKNAAYLSNDK